MRVCSTSWLGNQREAINPNNLSATWRLESNAPKRGGDPDGNYRLQCVRELLGLGHRFGWSCLLRLECGITLFFSLR